VYIRFTPQEVIAAASDSFRLAEKRIKDAPKELEKETSFILPKTAAREAVNVFQNSQGLVNVYLSENQVMFEIQSQELTSPKFQLTSQLIEGNYPEYQKIIPKEFKTSAIFNREALINKIVSIFSGRSYEVKISLKAKTQTVRLFAQSSEVGENEVLIPAKIQGEDLDISFNHRFLTEGLNKFKNSAISFYFSSAEGPAVLKSLEDESYLYVIMPIKQR